MLLTASHRISLIILTLVSGLGFWGGEVRGQIAAWDFTGVGSTSLPTFAATTFDANLITTSGANNITRGSTAAWNNASNSFRTTGFQNNGISILNTDFFQITLSATTGYKVSLSNINAKFAGTASFCVSPGVTNQFAYSLDGTNFTLIGSPQVLIGSPTTLTQIDLSGIPALQDVSSGTTITIRYYASGQTSTGGWGFNSLSSGSNGLTIGVSTAAITSDPTISLSPSTLSGFTYVLGNGPSAQQSFTVSGTNLTNNISITPPADYEISTSSGGPFTSSDITLNQSVGIVNSTPIYVRLKAGLGVNTYTESIDITSIGSAGKAVSCSGNVTPPTLVVISQVYGGGGNTVATYQNDYIELFNRGSSVVNLNNWSIQYASATGNTWTVVALTNTPLNPGQYYLIKLASSGAIGALLPAADLVNPTNISAAVGKVALSSSTTTLFGNCPTGSPIIDFLGYGATADCREGASVTNNAPAGSNTTSLFRSNGGCTDTDNNASDFTAAAPIPRNTSTATNPCTTPTITLSTTTLSGFTYILGNGPSDGQSFTVSGANLTANIIITAPANFQISTGTGALFVATSPITLTQSGGIVLTTTIYVRLKAGLAAGTYNGEIINLTSAGAISKTVTCSGNVTCSAIDILASNIAYTEDFNGLVNTGTSSFVPCGWAFAETGTGSNTFYSAGDGTLFNGDTYSFGTTASTERAFGGLLSGALVPTIGASFKNKTGDVINTLYIKYYGEQWRLGVLGREDRLDFQYSVNATSLTSPATWTNFDPLDFIAPLTSVTVGAVDGNNSTNRSLISANLIGLSIPNGATLWIRWNDFDATGSDDGLAVDDFSITALSPCAISISNFTPASGPEGTQVTINGSNFTNITNVQFNGINSTFIVNSSTQITATIPSGNTSGFITIINNTPCSSTSTTSFINISTDCSYAPELIISEYVEGSGTNKAIEIVNLTLIPRNLLGYKIGMCFNGSSSIGNTVNLPNYDLAVNGVYVVVTNDATDSTLRKKANYLVPSSSWFNGDDAVVLINGIINIDIFGNIGCDPGTAWTDGTISTYDQTLVRKTSVYAGITTDPGNTGCSFPTLSAEWDQFPKDDFSHLGTHGASAGVPPTLTNLSPQIVCDGGAATFSLTASLGNPTYSFVWKVLDNTGLWNTVPNGAPYTITNIGDNSTLDISNCPSSFHNYQYYCEVTNFGNSCFTASNAAKLSVANLWKGTTPNWESSTNWNCGTLPSSATNVIIPTAPSGGSMPVISSLISADCKNIEIQTSATLTINSNGLDNNGSLIVAETYTGPGKVIYNRYLTPAPALLSPNRRWFIVSSPVNTSLGGFDGSAVVHNGTIDYDFAPYFEPENEGWRYYPEGNLPSSLSNGKGFLARVNGSGILKFTGSLNNLDVTVPITNTATISNGVFNNGWNAVGNPFTSAIKITGADGFINQNFSKLEANYNAIYLWYQTDKTPTGTGSYTGMEQYFQVINNSGYLGKVYNGSISEDYVQAGQGFLINAGIQGASTVSFNKGTSGMQIHATAVTMKSNKTSWPGITLLATNNGRTRSTVVAFNQNMTTGLDPSYDAGLLTTSGFNLHTHLVTGANETNFAIQCLPDNMYDSLAVPIGIDLPQQGTLILKAACVILPEGIYPVIEDRLLQVNTPLKTETDSLTVDMAEATWGIGRFYLHFGGTALNTGINHMPASPQFTARYAGEKITIFGSPGQGSRAWLYDIKGRKLGTGYQLTSSNQNEIPATGLSSGIYLLKIEGKTYRQTLKITILNQ